MCGEARHDEPSPFRRKSASAKLRVRPAGFSMSCHVNQLCVRLFILLAVLLPLVAPASPAQAQNNVDLQLVLAVDASGSVNDTRFELQKQGYAAAFRNPQVIKAIMSGGEQAIAVTMMHGPGPSCMCRSCPGR